MTAPEWDSLPETAPFRIVCAPDKMRDALTARETARALADGVRAAGRQPVVHPVADGGEESRDALVAADDGARIVRVDSHDALGRPVATGYGLLSDGTAIVEAADVIGLNAVPPGERDIFAASSAGLATPLRAAIAGGCRQVIVQLGGTATMDGGLGFLAGLGCRLRDEKGGTLRGSGRDLLHIGSLDLTPARDALAGIDLVIATDVRNPLYGPDGAAHMFAQQKGAGPESVAVLDDGLRRLGGMLGEHANCPGGGAAGGLGAALRALGGRAESGVELILRRTGFDASLRGAALCITAEGKVDSGSQGGKAVSGVLSRCVESDVPCIILGGAIADTDELYEAGAAAVLAIGRQPRSLQEALSTTADDLRAMAYTATVMATRLSRTSSPVAPSTGRRR